MFCKKPVAALLVLIFLAPACVGGYSPEDTCIEYLQRFARFDPNALNYASLQFQAAVRDEWSLLRKNLDAYFDSGAEVELHDLAARTLNMNDDFAVVQVTGTVVFQSENEKLKSPVQDIFVLKKIQGVWKIIEWRY